MNLSTEAKVGSVSVIAFILLAYMIIHLGNFSFGDKGYQVQAVFGQVNGLKKGNALRYAGVDVGYVKEIEVLPEGAKVTFMVNPGVKIPVGSTFRIASDGLVGEKHINISPPSQSKGFLAPDDIVKGEDLVALDHVIASSDKVLAEVHELVKSLNEILGDDKVKAAMKESILNAKELTHNLNVMSAALARMAQNNEGNVNAMMGNLSAMSATLRDVAGRVDMMLTGVDNDGQTVRDLRETIQNIKNASTRIEKMAVALEGVVTDPETAKNIKETLRNARSVSEKANKMLTKVESISTKAGVEVLYDNKTGKYLSNADLRINTSPQDFAIIGVTGIGDGSKGNFQIGKGNEGFAGRAGVIDGEVGIGADAKLGKQLKLSLDVSDPNDVRVKLRTQYQLAPDTFIVGQTNNINKSSEKATYIGVRQNF
ncbi:MAG: Mammalian cell entry related domain protein [Firmicutes bacterium]|nr:Mammalian cell entry related domain protein [Bacillota bacterium]